MELFKNIDESSRDPSTMKSPVSVGAYTFDAFEERGLKVPSSYLSDPSPSIPGVRILSYLPGALGDPSPEDDGEGLDDLVSGWNVLRPLEIDGSFEQNALLGLFKRLPAPAGAIDRMKFRSCLLLPAFKIDPLIDRGDELIVQLSNPDGAERVEDFISSRHGELLGRADDSGTQLRVRVANAQTIYELARRPEVTAIQRDEVIELRNRGTAGVLQSGNPEYPMIFRAGLKGQGQIIGVVDAPLDPRHCFFFDPVQTLGGRHRKLRAYFGDLPDVSAEPTPHGTLVAGIAVGLDLLDPDDPKNGQAPESKLVFTDIARVRPASVYGTSIFNILEEQYDAGARIFSLSWGDDLCGERMNQRAVAEKVCPVSRLGRDLDRFSRRYEDTLVVVAASNGKRVTSPENALNPLAVGASGQSGGISSIYQCSQDPAQCSENRLGSGGAGPTIGGRRKPELFVPGCHVVSARAGTSCDLASAPGTRNHYGITPKECATSWAAPAAAGAGALVRQYYVEGWYPTGVAVSGNVCDPTGALLKATLMNATEDMAPDGYPTDAEGWGRLQLDDTLFLLGGERKLFAVDVWNKHAYAFRSEDQAAKYSFRVQKKGPVKITLTWTQPVNRWPTPNPDGNDLDLVVSVGGDYYCGNDPDMDAREGSPPRVRCEDYRDIRNNVEQVWLPRAVAGTYEVTIRSRRLQAQSRQGYALVVSGDLTFTPYVQCGGAMWQ